MPIFYLDAIRAFCFWDVAGRKPLHAYLYQQYIHQIKKLKMITFAVSLPAYFVPRMATGTERVNIIKYEHT